MNGEFIEALQQIAKEKDIPLETLIETVESALATAYKKNYPANTEIKVQIDAHKSASSPFRVFCERIVVDGPTDNPAEISLEDARRQDPDKLVGETVEEQIKTKTSDVLPRRRLNRLSCSAYAKQNVAKSLMNIMIRSVK